MTNIKVEWEMVPNDTMTEKRNILLAGGDYPHAFSRQAFRWLIFRNMVNRAFSSNSMI